jgi:hypothetical protein
MEVYCVLCGQPALGFAMADGARLCHADERSCYHLWTVYRARTLAACPHPEARRFADEDRRCTLCGEAVSP